MPDEPENVQATPPATPPTDVQATTVQTPAPDTAPDAAQQPDVQETEGEEIAETDPKALAKFKKREQRLRNERNEARDQLKTAREEQAAREQRMADEQTAQTAEQLATANRERDEARNEVATLRLENQLSGKVVDPATAARLMGSEFRNQDGTPNVDAFLERYPYMKAGGVTPAATAPDGAGGPQAGASDQKAGQISDKEKALAQAVQNGNRALAVSLESQLNELRKK